MSHKFIIILALSFALILFTGGLTLAQDEEAPPETPTCPTAPSPPTCSGNWTEAQYSCSTQCGGDILQRNRACSWSNGTAELITDEKGCVTGYDDCSGPYTSGCGNWGSASSIETCSAWQGCGSTEWSPAKNTCQCSDACLETPKNPRYYNNPTYSDEPAKDIGNSNINLPVKLDWDDVKGWGETDGPQSYVALSQALNHSEYIPGACLFQPNKTINWGAKACCRADGTNCGPESSWNFKTSRAPELISPADPDWTGKEEAKSVSLPVTLDWCDVEEAESWLMQIHIVENGVEKCHPWLADGTNCGTWPVRKEKKPPPYKEKPKLLSEFFDKEGFFTKNTDYSWRLATCLREDNTDCSSFSQQWQFKTADVILTDFTLIYPPNDPLGQTPVGLPINFEWAGRPDTNSFNYTIGQFSGTTLSRGVTLDYDKLSLNTSYQWTVEPCWDYEGKKCETDLIKTGYFKTTGAPPALNYPTPNASDVIIPINFNWDDVPGAKSYVMKISGNGLSKEMALNDKLEAKLDYPDLKMSSNYSWQVKTCAKESGQICGVYGSPQNFKTFKLSPPGAPEAPSSGGTLFTDEHSVSWKKIDGAEAYQYQIKYLSMDAEEQDQTCAAMVGKEMFGQPKNVSVNSDFVELLCLGQYQWQTRSCLDLACQETSDWSGAWTFTLSEGGAAKGGLAPCGRKADTAGTPWNEREPCQVKHLFLLVKIIIDFLLFRLVPFGLILLTIYTAFIFYLSWKGVGALAQVIALWKAVGAGLVIMFFAWTAVNFFLKLIGYQVGIFGNWYQL